jgi:hypothetical protein
MLDAWGIGVLSQSLARVSNTRFFFMYLSYAIFARRPPGTTFFCIYHVVYIYCSSF